MLRKYQLKENALVQFGGKKTRRLQISIKLYENHESCLYHITSFINKYSNVLIPDVSSLSVTLLVENETSTDGKQSKHSTRDTGKQVKRMVEGWTRTTTTTSTGNEPCSTVPTDDMPEVSKSACPPVSLTDAAIQYDRLFNK